MVMSAVTLYVPPSMMAVEVLVGALGDQVPELYVDVPPIVVMVGVPLFPEPAQMPPIVTDTKE